MPTTKHVNIICDASFVMKLHQFLENPFRIFIRFFQFCRCVFTNLLPTYVYCVYLIFNTILPLLLSVWITNGCFYNRINTINNMTHLAIFQINDSNLGCLSSFCYRWKCPLRWVVSIIKDFSINNSFDLSYIFSLMLLIGSTLTVNVRVKTTPCTLKSPSISKKVSIF